MKAKTKKPGSKMGVGQQVSPPTTVPPEKRPDKGKGKKRRPANAKPEKDQDFVERKSLPAVRRSRRHRPTAREQILNTLWRDKLLAELPYGTYITADREVLHNRKYHPIWERTKEGAIAKRVDPKEWVKNIVRQTYVLEGGDRPWEKRDGSPEARPYSANGGCPSSNARNFTGS